AVDTDESGSFTATPVVVDGVTISLTQARLFVSGTLSSLNIAGLVSGSAHFEVVKDVVDADVDGTAGFDPATDLNDAVLLTFALTSLQLKVGTDSFGISITSGEVRVATLAPSSPPYTRRWLAVQASNVGASLSVGSLLSATLTDVAVQVNQASATAPATATALDWTSAIDTDETGTFTATPVTVDGQAISLTQ